MSVPVSAASDAYVAAGCRPTYHPRSPLPPPPPPPPPLPPPSPPLPPDIADAAYVFCENGARADCAQGAIRCIDNVPRTNVKQPG